MGIYDGLKDAAVILKEAGKIEQYKQILEVQEKLLEMQKNIGELETENIDLKEKLKLTGEIFFESNAYWLVSDKKEGPFCSCCWDDERKTIRMQPCGNPAYYDCPKCENKRVKVFPERNNFPTASVIQPDYI